MVAEALVDRSLELGRNAVNSLRMAGEKPEVAFWQYLPEVERWRLYLAYPDLNRLGPKTIYERIQPHVSFPIFGDISVIDSTDRRVKVFRRALKARSEEIDGIRFRGSAGDAGYIEDAYIYRL
jgi:hypothetical protein